MKGISTRERKSKSEINTVSDENKHSPDEMYGFHNLCYIIIIVSIAKNLLSYILEFGILIRIPLSAMNIHDSFVFLIVFIFNVARTVLSYRLKVSSTNDQKNNIKIINKTRGNIAFIAASEILLSLIILYKIKYIYIAAWAHLILIVTDMKLYSFIKCTGEKCTGEKCTGEKCTGEKCTGEKCTGEKCTGEKCTGKHFIRFMISPFLVYEDTEYTKDNIKDGKRRIFNRNIAMKFINIFLSSMAFIIIMDQYAMPAIYKTGTAVSIMKLCEGFLNISIATVILFSIFFHICFRCIIPILAEISGTRNSNSILNIRNDKLNIRNDKLNIRNDKFYISNNINSKNLNIRNDKAYEQWWNALSAGEFWAKWNLPVHNFIKKYIYSELLARGYSNFTSGAFCFVFSGLVHEWVIALCIKKITGFFFIGMVAQIPLIWVSEWIKRHYRRWANAFFWLSFCFIGQSLIFLLFVRAVYLFEDYHLHGLSIGTA
ncbi:diacylglycerol O-acyltransferase 1 [Enteropsectra breve]|nr:diacylglycerol O-acyltransferase 1 [Enteropsectra breve]